MAEWHQSPDYIINNWTDELLKLMIEKLAERKQRELDSIKGETKDVPLETLANVSHGAIKVVKHEKGGN